jgi:hypothetical protein
MLKLTYTEAGLHLERVSMSLEAMIAQRVLLTMRLGQKLHIEPSSAAFLLPVDVSGLAHLDMALRLEQTTVASIVSVDNEYVEVSLRGSWLAESAEVHEGILVTVCSHRVEFLIDKLWQVTQTQVSYLA